MLYVLPFILEFLSFYTTLHGFLEVSKNPKKKDIILFVFFMFLTILSSKYSITAWILGQIFYCIYTLTFNNKELINTLLLYIISYCTVVFSQLCIVFIMQFFNCVLDIVSSLVEMVQAFPLWLSVPFGVLLAIAILFRVSQFVPTIGGASN